VAGGLGKKIQPFSKGILMNSHKENILIEYLKEMRAEINLRIGNHNKLVATKVVTCGALLSFLFTKNLEASFKIYGFILVPIISMLYDVMIAKNIRCIHRIGSFIRDIIEEELLPEIELWEKYAGQKDVKIRNYGKADVFFLSLFSLATISFPVMILWINGKVIHSIGTGLLLLSFQTLIIVLMCKWILFFIPREQIEKKPHFLMWM
jgi:hypothetical protein